MRNAALRAAVVVVWLALTWAVLPRDISQEATWRVVVVLGAAVLVGALVDRWWLLALPYLLVPALLLPWSDILGTAPAPDYSESIPLWFLLFLLIPYATALTCAFAGGIVLRRIARRSGVQLPALSPAARSRGAVFGLCVAAVCCLAVAALTYDPPRTPVGSLKPRRRRTETRVATRSPGLTPPRATAACWRSRRPPRGRRTSRGSWPASPCLSWRAPCTSVSDAARREPPRSAGRRSGRNPTELPAGLNVRRVGVGRRCCF